MKICYCDESGTGGEPISVMTGIVVDTQRMHLTKKDWLDLLKSLSRTAKAPIKELHTTDFYRGNSPWRDLDGPSRAGVITDVLDWLSGRKHKLVFTAVDTKAFIDSNKAGLIKPEVNNLWRFMGMHLILALQRQHQAAPKNKGNTMLVFDNKEQERMSFGDLITSPPHWSDSYYSKKKKDSQLNQIIDVPYFADSKQVALIQIADFVSYFLRRHLEIEEGHSKEKFPDEGKKVSEWIAKIKAMSLPPQATFPATGRCQTAEMFFDLAPPAARELLR